MSATFCRAIAAHFARIEAADEPFSRAPAGYRAALYAPENLRKQRTDTGWSRLWVERDQNGIVVAHASAYALTPGDHDMVSGDIVVEREYRRKGFAARLQAAQARWLDKNALALAGPIAAGNAASLHCHLAAGYVQLRVDPETGDQWVVRFPRAPGKP